MKLNRPSPPPGTVQVNVAQVVNWLVGVVLFLAALHFSGVLSNIGEWVPSLTPATTARTVYESDPASPGWVELPVWTASTVDMPPGYQLIEQDTKDGDGNPAPEVLAAKEADLMPALVLVRGDTYEAIPLPEEKPNWAEVLK